MVEAGEEPGRPPGSAREEDEPGERSLELRPGEELPHGPGRGLLVPGAGQGPEVEAGEQAVEPLRAGAALLPGAVAAGEAQAQGVVVAGDPRHRAGEEGGRQGGVDLDQAGAGEQVGGGEVARDAVEEPALPRGQGTGPVTQPCSAPAAPEASPAAAASSARVWCWKTWRSASGIPPGRRGRRAGWRGESRLPGEEAVVRADPVAAQEVSPDAGEPLLGGRARRDEVRSGLQSSPAGKAARARGRPCRWG